MMPLVARLTANWQLKLLALFFAVTLWVFVVFEDKGEAVYTVPLVMTGVPPGLEVTAVGAKTVDVRVQGLRSVLGHVQDRDIRAEVSLRDARPGEVLARVLPQDVVVPRGVQVVRVTPSRVAVALEKK
jgi:YbbR domain-containing protein